MQPILTSEGASYLVSMGLFFSWVVFVVTTFVLTALCCRLTPCALVCSAKCTHTSTRGDWQVLLSHPSDWIEECAAHHGVDPM